MTRFDRVEPRLAELITELAAPSLPDYTDDVLARTAGLRQRPRWTLLERWLPMGVLAQRSAYIPRVPWRAIIVAALLLVVIAATLAWVGSQRRAAPPFGPARNGLIMYTVDGDLLSWDPGSGASRTLLEGATDDFTGIYSRDGTKLAFLRRERPPQRRAGADQHPGRECGRDEPARPDRPARCPGPVGLVAGRRRHRRAVEDRRPPNAPGGADRRERSAARPRHGDGGDVAVLAAAGRRRDHVPRRRHDARRPAQRPVRDLSGGRRAAAADGDRRRPRRRLPRATFHPPTARTCCTACGIPSP